MRPKLMVTGVVGAVVTAVCCFTPVLVFALGAVGLSAWVGGLDLVLLPLLGLFVALAVFAAFSRTQKRSP